MAAKKAAKRLGKKHRQASTRPHKGKAPRATPTTGAVDPRKRKVIATKQAKAAAAKRVSKRSPEFESKRTITAIVRRSRRARAPSAGLRRASTAPTPRTPRPGVRPSSRRCSRASPLRLRPRRSCRCRHLRPAERGQIHAVQPRHGLAPLHRGDEPASRATASTVRSSGRDGARGWSIPAAWYRMTRR